MLIVNIELKSNVIKTSYKIINNKECTILCDSPNLIYFQNYLGTMFTLNKLIVLNCTKDSLNIDFLPEQLK